MAVLLVKSEVAAKKRRCLEYKDPSFPNSLPRTRKFDISEESLGSLNLADCAAKAQDLVVGDVVLVKMGDVVVALNRQTLTLTEAKP